jgi:hypothetical protein
VPSEGSRPAFLALEVKAQEVNWVPWSPWMIAPGEGLRESMAIPGAFVARSATCGGEGIGHVHGAFSACVRTILENGRGPNGNRHSPRRTGAESVLIPRPTAGR